MQFLASQQQFVKLVVDTAGLSGEIAELKASDNSNAELIRAVGSRLEEESSRCRREAELAQSTARLAEQELGQRIEQLAKWVQQVNRLSQDNSLHLSQHSSLLNEVCRNNKSNAKTLHFMVEKLDESCVDLSLQKDQLRALKQILAIKAQRTQLEKVKKEVAQLNVKMSHVKALQESMEGRIFGVEADDKDRRETTEAREEPPRGRSKTREQHSDGSRLQKKLDELEIKLNKVIEIEKRRSHDHQLLAKRSKEVNYEEVKAYFDSCVQRVEAEIKKIESSFSRNQADREAFRVSVARQTASKVDEAVDQLAQRMRRSQMEVGERIYGLTAKLQFQRRQESECVKRKWAEQEQKNALFELKVGQKAEKAEVKKALQYLEGKLKQVIQVVTNEGQLDSAAFSKQTKVRCVSCEKEAGQLAPSCKKDSVLEPNLTESSLQESRFRTFLQKRKVRPRNG